MTKIQERLAARAEAAVERHGDQGEAVTGGGGEFSPPPAGKARARLVGYIETGPQKDAKYPDKKPANKFQLVFALFGKNSQNESWARDDGKPMVISSRTLTVSRNEKATALKLFKRMCPKGDAQHFLGLLGRAYTLQIEHTTVPSSKAGEKDKVYANIKEDSLAEAVKAILDDDDNVVGYEPLKVPDAPDDFYKVLEWDVPSKEDFEAVSEYHQKRLRSAVGFKESAWFTLVGGGNPAASNAPEEEQLPALDSDEDAPVEDTKVEDTPVVTPTEVVEVSEDDLPPL